MENLVADLAEHRVVELEERHLIATALRAHIAEVFCRHLLVAVVGFELRQHLIGTVNDAAGHTCEFRHMNTETVLAAALFEFAHKHHLAIDFLHAHIVVANAAERFFHLVQLVVVGGEKRFGMGATLVNVFHNAPGNGNAVVGGCATTQLIEQHKAALAQVVED